MTLFLTLLSLGFYPAPPALAAEIHPVVFSTTTAEDIVRSYAIHYAVSGDELWATIKCEDPQLDPKVRGDKGLARGLAQIRSDYWPSISDAKADDPLFAIDFIASQFSKGNAHYWSCYGMIK